MLSVQPDILPIPNLINYQIPINKGGFKYTYDYVINNEKYKSNVAKGTGNKTDDSISKFAGDFYQILTALRMQKAGQLYVPASGDGMFCVIYAYLAKHVYKITPRMIFIKDIVRLITFKCKLKSY